MKENGIIEMKNGDFRVTYTPGPLSCSVAGGITFLCEMKDGTKKEIFFPPGYTLEKVMSETDI